MQTRPKPKLVKDVTVEVVAPQENPIIGKLCDMQLKIASAKQIFLKYVLFELTNERTDKRAPMDRVTSRSRYLYRFNVESMLDPSQSEPKVFHLRIPVHKEPSRNDKFIHIRWEVNAKAIFCNSEEDKEWLESPVSNNLEIEVV